VVPDPQTDPFFYHFIVSGLDFFPGETIHVDMTITTLEDSAAFETVTAFDGNSNPLAQDQLFLDPEVQSTVSVDYVVVAGDDADGAGASANSRSDNGFTLNDVNFSCTPAS
jgi:hypothetical protein